MSEQNKNNIENNQGKVRQLAVDVVSLIHNNPELTMKIGPAESVVVKDTTTAKYYELSYFNTDDNTVSIDLLYGLEDKTREDASLPLVTSWSARIVDGRAVVSSNVDGRIIERDITLAEIDELQRGFIDPHVLSEQEHNELEKLLVADKSLEYTYADDDMKSVETVASAHTYQAKDEVGEFTEEGSRRISAENNDEGRVKRVVRKALGGLARSLGEPDTRPDAPKPFPRRLE